MEKVTLILTGVIIALLVYNLILIEKKNKRLDKLENTVDEFRECVEEDLEELFEDLEDITADIDELRDSTELAQDDVFVAIKGAVNKAYKKIKKKM